VGNNRENSACKWVGETEDAAQCPKNKSTFNWGIVVGVPVLDVKKILGDPVLVPIVVAEIELARNYVVLHSNHAFKEFECASVGFYFHRESFMVEVKEIMENCMDFSTRPIGVFVTVSMLEVTIKIHNKRQKVIHIADREEIRRNGSVVRLQKLMEEVLVVGTVQDRKRRAQGASHCNTYNLAK
jgi:hypothetical protein